MTTNNSVLDIFGIIPYQELLGNYDLPYQWGVWTTIIPYQELLGNYDAIRGAS